MKTAVQILAYVFYTEVVRADRGESGAQDTVDTLLEEIKRSTDYNVFCEHVQGLLDDAVKDHGADEPTYFAHLTEVLRGYLN